jgi:hypothetical protein
MSVAGMAQSQENGYVEASLVTSGDDVAVLKRLNTGLEMNHTAKDVMQFLLTGLQDLKEKGAAVQNQAANF